VRELVFVKSGECIEDMRRDAAIDKTSPTNAFDIPVNAWQTYRFLTPSAQ